MGLGWNLFIFAYFSLLERVIAFGDSFIFSVSSLNLWTLPNVGTLIILNQLLLTMVLLYGVWAFSYWHLRSYFGLLAVLLISSYYSFWVTK